MGLASSPTARSAERDEGIVGAVAWIHRRIQGGRSRPVGSSEKRASAGWGGEVGDGSVRTSPPVGPAGCSTVAVGVSVGEEAVEVACGRAPPSRSRPAGTGAPHRGAR